MLGEKKKAQRRLKGPESRASEVEKPGFSRKEASILAERSKHLPKMSLCFGNISYCFPQYLLLLFQIRHEEDTPSSGWQLQTELSEVTKKTECDLFRSTFTTDTIFSFHSAHYQSKIQRNISPRKTCRTRFFIRACVPVQNKRF